MMRNKINQTEPFSRFTSDDGVDNSRGGPSGKGFGGGRDEFKPYNDATFDCRADGVGRGNGGTGKYGWCNFWGNGRG